MKIGLIAHPDELTKREIDEIRAAGADVLGLHPVGGKKATSSLENLLKWLKTDEGRSLLSYARSLGLKSSTKCTRRVFSFRASFSPLTQSTFAKAAASALPTIISAFLRMKC